MYGTLTVITGPMFAGKTTKLIETAEQTPGTIFRPSFDVRYSDSHVVTHNGKRLPAQAIASVDDVVIFMDSYKDKQVYFDECQFFFEPYFQGNFVEMIRRLLQNNINVCCAGLDMNFMGEPFHITAMLLAMADEVDKLKAVCAVSGNPASKVYKRTHTSEIIELGGADKYEARSNEHWQTS